MGGGSGGSVGDVAAAEDKGARDGKETSAGAEERKPGPPATALPNIKRQLSAFAVSAVRAVASRRSPATAHLASFPMHVAAPS